MDDYFIEHQIERLVWQEFISASVKSKQTDLKFHVTVTDFDHFRLFCIFNRFASSNLKLEDARAAFVMRKFGNAIEKGNCFNFLQFLANSIKCT